MKDLQESFLNYVDIMKTSNIRILMLIGGALTLVCAYQVYWLIGQYYEIKQRLEEDIQEVLRSSDFEELVHRVDEISRMEFQGRVDVNVGYDHTSNQSVTRSTLRERGDQDQDKEEGTQEERSKEMEYAAPQRGTQTVVSPATFGSILKRPQDLVNIGLNMQRGIHSSLDNIKDVDIEYLDRIIARKLDSIGVGGIHHFLYIRDFSNTEGVARKDTLAEKGGVDTEDADTFSLKISDNSEYQMIIPRWNLAVLRKMIPVILFSIITLLLLAATFTYLIRNMRRHRQIEEMKTDFTNNITHELKTPIAIAFAANDALLNFDSANNTPRMNRYLKICQEQLRLLDRLVEQILSLSMERKKALLLNSEEVDINEMLSVLINTFRLKYPDGVDFYLNVQEGLILNTDRMHLSNIVGNLIDNAIKYSKGKAQVTLHAFREDCGKFVIEVEDKGIGISSEQQKLIFQKFYRVPHGNVHDVKGYGLGLFYVQSMTEKLGGTVSVRSSLGKGSCFTLIFCGPAEQYSE